MAANSKQITIDWQLALRRLTAFATQHLLFKSHGYRGGDVLIRGTGDTTADIAFDVWEEAFLGRKCLPEGTDSTNKVLGVLIKRLKLELLTRARHQSEGKTVYAWDTETPLTRVSATDDEEMRDDTEDRIDAEDAHIGYIDWEKARGRILQLARASGNPDLVRFVELQCSNDGFRALSRSQAARLLDVSPAAVTNLQKSFRRVLLRLYPGQQKAKKARRQGRRVREKGSAS